MQRNPEQQNVTGLAVAASALLALPLICIAAGPTPGLYEYTMTADIPGMPANAMDTRPQVRQECVTAAALGSGQYGPMPKDGNCQIRDMNESGGQFSYRFTCTGPQKMDGTVKGSATAIAFDTTMSMGNGHTMKLSMTGKRIGDCRQ